MVFLLPFPAMVWFGSLGWPHLGTREHLSVTGILFTKSVSKTLKEGSGPRCPSPVINRAGDRTVPFLSLWGPNNEGKSALNPSWIQQRFCFTSGCSHLGVSEAGGDADNNKPSKTVTLLVHKPSCLLWANPPPTMSILFLFWVGGWFSFSCSILLKAKLWV